MNLKLVQILTFGFSLIIALGAYLTLSGDPRFLDGALTHDEAKWYELFIIIGAAISVISLWGLSVVHSFKHSSKSIAILLFFVWPLSFVYAWRSALQKN